MNKNNIIYLAFVSILFLNIGCLAAMSRDENLLAFSEANKAFLQANKTNNSQDARKFYEQAILGYEKIIDHGGIKNAKLYCNLANAYLLNDNVAKAILNYRRAQTLDNSSPEIYKNLNFARSKRVDNIAISVQKKVMERLFFWHYDFAMKTRCIIGGVFFAVFCIWLTLRIWLIKWPVTAPVCVISFLLTLCMVLSVLAEYHSSYTNRSGVITAESVVARQGDGINYPQSFNEPLHSGLEFDLLEQRSGWLHIRIANGHDAWIPEQSAEQI
jgi:tetratricopeptide (TPR) repeat protein